MGNTGYYRNTKFGLLSGDELNEYIRKYKNGDKSVRNIIINNNMRLIFSIINKHNIFSSKQNDVNELIEAGIIGLAKALDFYNIDSSTTFSTYASKCIYNEMLKCILKLNKSISKISLDEVVFFDAIKPTYLFDVIPSSDNIIFNYENKELYEKMKNTINLLPDKQRKIIMLRFGFIDGECHTITSICKIMGLSRTCVSRNLNKAFEYIKGELIKYDDELMNNDDEFSFAKW